MSWLHDEISHKTYSRGGAENEGQDCTEHFNVGNFKKVLDPSVFPVSFTYGELVFARINWEENMVGKNLFQLENLIVLHATLWPDS